MTAAASNKNAVLKRVNTRIFRHQDEYIKKVVSKSKGALGEGEFHRELLERGIASHKAEKSHE